MTGAVSFLLLALSTFLAQQTPEHPVPLPADFNPADCVQCHDDKQKGKFVHTAISMGCPACHAVEIKDDATRIGLIAPKTELCATCHEQLKETTLHGPYAQKQCFVCHDPHASDNPAHTRAALNSLCLACHAERTVQGETVNLFGSQTVTAEAFNHAPKILLDASQRIGHPFLEHPVAGRKDPLHQGQELSCLSCHLPHAAPIPKLLPEQWKEIAICDQCHNAIKAEKNREKEKGRQNENEKKNVKENEKP